MLDDKEFVFKHGVIPVEKKLLFPITPDRKSDEPIVKAILREYGPKAIAGAIVGGIAGGVLGSVVGAAGIPVITGAIRGFSDYLSDIQNPLKKYFDFNVRDFVGLIGCKKDLNFDTGLKDLVTAKFEIIKGMEYGGPDYDTHDYDFFRIIAKVLISNRLEKEDEELRSKYLYEEKFREYVETLLEKDVMSIGGPIPLDPLFDKMKERAFPCNYDLVEERKFFPDKKFKKYPIQISEKYLGMRERSEFEPEWNKVNFGLISRLDKKSVFDKGSGVFVNVSGCNWQGTAGASSYLCEKEKLDMLVQYIKDNKALDKSFQVVVETPLTEQGVPETEKTKLIDIFTF